MTLLRTRNKKERGYIIVGVAIPPQLYNYLTLYVLSKGITKAEIIRTLLERWYNGEDTLPESELIQAIITRSNAQWRLQHLAHPEETIITFKDKLEKELVLKGLTQGQLLTILNGVHDGTCQTLRET